MIPTADFYWLLGFGSVVGFVAWRVAEWREALEAARRTPRTKALSPEDAYWQGVDAMLERMAAKAAIDAYSPIDTAEIRWALQRVEPQTVPEDVLDKQIASMMDTRRAWYAAHARDQESIIRRTLYPN